MLHWLTECSQCLHERVLHKCLDPNIVGKLAADHTGATLEGAFASAGDSDAKNHADGGAISRVSFDASRCSSEYVTGANLQVSALQTLACIKA